MEFFVSKVLFDEIGSGFRELQGANPSITHLSFFIVVLSFTYSFGSICFGSLLQALVAVIRRLVENARRQREQNGSGTGGILLCLLDCK